MLSRPCSFFRIGLIGLGMIVLVATGCRTVHPPPVDEITTAHRTLADAWENAGDVFSPGIMIRVRSQIDQSLEAYHSGDFLAARLYAERATADARLASAVSETERLRFHLDTLQVRIQAYQDTINRSRADRALLEQEISTFD